MPLVLRLPPLFRAVVRCRAFSPLVAAAAALARGCRRLRRRHRVDRQRAAALPTDDAALRAYADHWGKLYDANPGEKYASINYARALRALTRYTEAASVMQAAAVKAPKDFEVLGAYGKALADYGRARTGQGRAVARLSAERPDWTILSVQGSVADRLNDHEAAQQFYRDALKIAPGEPRAHNLGLSYALTKNSPLAEEALRQAAASPRADARVRKIWRWCSRSKANSPRPSRSAARTCRPRPPRQRRRRSGR